jgi:hypothetical protein
MTRLRSLCAVSCMLLAAVLSTAMLTACKKKPFELKNPAAVGKWEGVGQTAELFRDGKITLVADGKSKQSKGSYEFIDEDTIRVRFKGSRPRDYSIALTGEVLKITRTDGTLVGEFKRVNQPQTQGEG